MFFFFLNSGQSVESRNSKRHTTKKVPGPSGIKNGRSSKGLGVRRALYVAIIFAKKR